MASDDERFAARAHLANHIAGAVVAAIQSHTQPELVFAAAPMTLAGMAGAQFLTLLREGYIADGELDRALALACDSLRRHADPSLNPAPAGPVGPARRNAP